MPIKLYMLEEDGKYKDMVVLESDKAASAEVHRSIYHFPEEPFTRVRPIKEKEGFDRYFVNGVWEYREIVEEPVENEEGEEDAGSQD